MLTMARDRTYEELVPELRGRRVLIWTCSTCARLCGGLGGRESADSLAERLRADGADVAGTVCSAACCLSQRSEEMASSSPKGYDLVLALCCSLGAWNAEQATGADVLNPVRTFGPGMADPDGVPLVAVMEGGRVVGTEPLQHVAEEAGCLVGPFRYKTRAYKATG